MPDTNDVQVQAARHDIDVIDSKIAALIQIRARHTHAAMKARGSNDRVALREGQIADRYRERIGGITADRAQDLAQAIIEACIEVSRACDY